MAHAFALQEWIGCDRSGKIACYTITPVGRAALKRLLTEERIGRETRDGFAEAQAPFQEQHRFFAERLVMAEDGSGERKLRFNLAESPLSVLGRKRDKDGAAYLTAELIEAGERLREDFELAQMGPRITQNWERFLTAGGRARRGDGPRAGEGPQDARVRVAKAMEALGPGLSDIVFRVCCFLEGLETAEKRLGWSARSGKVVLKIALERLAAHYQIAPAEPRRRGGLSSARGGDDRAEVGGVQRGAADQRAVDVGDGEDLGGVAGLHRSAVEQADRSADRPAEAPDRRSRMKSCTSAISSRDGVRPVPIAQTGS